MKATVMCLAALATSLCAADKAGPFAGTWKLNLQKSRFTGETVRYEPASNGMTRFSVGDLSYDFALDGNDHPAFLGYTAAWKQSGPDAYQYDWKLNGKTLNTASVQLSPDGKAMTVTTKGTKPDGQPFEEVARYERVSGSKGLNGSWRSTKVNVSAPETLQIAADGPDGIVITNPSYQMTIKAKFDGKEYPAAGPTLPSGVTVSVKQPDPRTVEVIYKKDGKAVETSRMQLSADGKTMTETMTLAGSKDKPMVAVFDKQ